MLKDIGQASFSKLRLAVGRLPCITCFVKTSNIMLRKKMGMKKGTPMLVHDCVIRATN